jgi:hypothetical protein
VTADTVIDGENSVIGWNRYAYCKNNPIIYKDPSGHLTIAIELDKNNPHGGKAVQLFEGGSLIKTFDKWVTRGVSKNGEEVAIQSGLYKYKVEDSSNQFLKDTPRLKGKADHSGQGPDVSGGHIKTLGANRIHTDRSGNPQNFADGIRIHQMNTQIRPSGSHGGKPWVGSEGCQGPVGAGDTAKFMEGKKRGDEGSYLLFRPSEFIDKAKSKASSGLENIKTKATSLVEKILGS